MVTIDPTVPETPPGSGIFWDSQGGTWVDTRHGNAPWNANTGWGQPQASTAITPTPVTPQSQYPSLPAQTASAGNIATLSGATLNNAQAGAIPAQTAATTANAAANTANAATNAQIAANTAARNQQLHEEMLASQGLTQQQITNSYNKDVATYGIDKATLLLNSRQAAAKSLLDSANFQLNQNAQNAQSRQVMASQQLEALKMLAARNGPQDYTHWDYITGMGGNAPKPQDSRTYSPLDMIAAQYQPSNIAAPPGFDASGIDVGGYPSAAPAAITPSGGGGGGATAPVSATTGNNTFGASPAGGIQWQQPQSPPSALKPAGYLPQVASGMAAGGTTSGAAVVGDSESGKPTKHEEVAYASNNPKTGVAELHVIPHHMLAGMVDEATGRRGGMIMHANKVPKEITHMLPRAAEGGVYGGEGVGSSGPEAGYMTQGGVEAGPPQYKPSPGMTIQPQVPVTQYQPQSAPGTMAGGTPNPVPPTTPQPLSASGTMAGGYPNPIGPQSAPGTMEGGYPNPTGTGGGTSLPATSSSPLPAAQPANLVGNWNFGGTAAPPPQSLGPAGYDPYRITKNQYSPYDMNNSPLLQMLRGQRPVYGFQGQGDYRPGIESQGITDLPINLNYADYLRMDPTRQKMIQGIYDNPETGESWDQILSMAKAAAPRTGNLRVASAR